MKHLILLIALVASARANSIVPLSTSVSWGNFDHPSFNIPDFDPTLGTLDSVYLLISSAVNLTFTWTGPSGPTGWAGQAIVKVGTPKGDKEDDRLISGSGNSPGTGFSSAQPVVTATYTSNLGDFIGTGTWQLLVSNSTQFFIEDHPRGGGISINENWLPLSLYVDYEYTPIASAVPIPEPKELLGLAAAALIAALLHRKRRT